MYLFPKNTLLFMIENGASIYGEWRVKQPSKDRFKSELMNKLIFLQSLQVVGNTGLMTKFWGIFLEKVFVKLG